MGGWVSFVTGHWSKSSELIEVYEGLLEEDKRAQQRSTVSKYTERYVPLVEEDMLAEPVVAAGEDHILCGVWGYSGGDVVEVCSRKIARRALSIDVCTTVSARKQWKLKLKLTLTLTAWMIGNPNPGRLRGMDPGRS
jgi:hypothetical protein